MDNKPLPPEILADALQDVAHKEIGKGRAAKSTKVFGLPRSLSRRVSIMDAMIRATKEKKEKA